MSSVDTLTSTADTSAKRWEWRRPSLAEALLLLLPLAASTAAVRSRY